MRSFAIAALVGSISAAPATVFQSGDAPKCYVLANGETKVEYTGSDIHPSFKCTHTGNVCKCSNPHPTHHTGGCMQLDHTSGKTQSVSGDCSDSGLNAIDGAWSGYTYGTCSKSCGTGTQSMTRACDSPAPFNGGADCAGSTTSSQNCNTHACPVNGGWSGYTYAACSKSCGTGTQTLTRSCNSPSVANGGANCAGATSTSQNCNTHACPVNGVWSGWTTGACSASCGDGTVTSTRTCDGRSNGGADCAGSTTSTAKCNLGSCEHAGDYTVTNHGISDTSFTNWANQAGVQAVEGDFDGDGKIDVALCGVSGWGSVPIAFSNGDGNFRITNHAISNFAGWAASSGVTMVAGDFNGDGKTDLAISGGPGWTTIPVAFSGGDGTFSVTNHGVSNLPGWSRTDRAKFVAGDFNGDGKDDLVVVGGHGWGSIPTGFSNGDGTFSVTNRASSNFPGWADEDNVKILTGDFDGDGKSDLVLTGVSGWGSMPTAFSNGDGTYTISNNAVTNMPSWSTAGQVKFTTCDIDGDGKDDVVMTGGDGWSSIPTGFSTGRTGFRVTNQAVSNFPGWANNADATLLCGDLNGDGKGDELILTGGKAWTSVPVAW